MGAECSCSDGVETWNVLNTAEEKLPGSSRGLSSTITKKTEIDDEEVPEILMAPIDKKKKPYIT